MYDERTTFRGQWIGRIPATAALAFLLAAAFPSIAFGQAATFPYTEGFETGALAAEWQANSTSLGRIQVTTANLPNAGTYHVVMDTASSGTYALNEMTLTIDLTGQSGVYLSFFAKDFGDEWSAMPVTFTGSANADGVAISVDGSNWFRAIDLGAFLTGAYQQFVVDLDAIMTANSLTYNSTFRIRFQQYDNYYVAIDGIAFDDIAVQPATAPAITSTPVTAALAGSTYIYDVNAGGVPAPTYALTAAPTGMTINAATGVITWVPGAADIAASPHSVTVEATNGGGTDTQNYQITVTGNPPSITSTPVTTATAGVLYTYDVNATGNPPPTYSVTVAPTGMTISVTTGLISWTPTAAQIGTQNVTVGAANGLAPDDTQSFTITVSGLPPTITTIPITGAFAGLPYLYDVDATASPAATYTLDAGPTGMTIDGATGAISWAPTAADLGTHTVTVTASNGWTPDDTQSYTLSVNFPASFPFLEDFETGSVAAYWQTASTGQGRVQITTASVPNSGTYHAVMDTASAGPYALNELTLTIDLAGQSAVFLAFFAKDFGDEWSPMPATFSGSVNADGVAISVDGNTWYRAFDLGALLTGAYQPFSLDLDAFMAANGLTYATGVRIRFQQYDNFPVATDGIAFDDIQIYSATVTPSMSVVPAADFVSSGAQGGPFTPPSTTYAIQNLGGGTVDFTVAVDQPWITVSPTSGSDSPPLPGVPVSVSVNAGADFLPIGMHFATLTITNTTNGIGDTTRTLLLIIDPPGLPPNDAFVDAVTLVGTSVNTLGWNAGASTEAGEPAHAGNAGGASVWWTWTAPVNGTVTVSTAGSTIDTVLAVYTGTTVDTLTEVASNDNESLGLFTSSVTFQATLGTTYYIAVDGFNYGAGADLGGILLSLGVEGSTLNDDFANRIVQSGPSVSTTGTNAIATLEAGEPMHAGNAGGASVRWTWTAVADGNVTISTAGSNFDTVLGVYTGWDVSALIEVASNDDESAGVTTSLVTFAAVAGTVYQIAVDGSGGVMGNVQLSIQGASPSIPRRGGGGGGCGSVGLDLLLPVLMLRWGFIWAGRWKDRRRKRSR